MPLWVLSQNRITLKGLLEAGSRPTVPGMLCFDGAASWCTRTHGAPPPLPAPKMRTVPEPIFARQLIDYEKAETAYADDLSMRRLEWISW
jgi:hypothetical protein